MSRRRAPLPFSAAALVAAATAVGSLAAVPARGGHRDLVREWESYEPPALYRTAPQPQPRAAEGTGALEAQAARLREAGTRWERAVEQPSAGESFFLPDPARLERLRPAASDPAAAVQSLADGFMLEDLEALAWLRNPGALARERELRAAAEAYGQVANLDEVLRQYASYTQSLMPGVGAMEGPESMSSRFPFPGILSLKGRVAQQGASAAREELEKARREALTAARKTYWELLYAGRAREVTGRMLDLLEHLRAASSARYEAGETSFQDLVKVNIERERMREELRTLTGEEENARAMVREVLALPPQAAVGSPAPRDPGGALPDDPGDLYPLALERRQEVRRMEAMIAQMEAMIEMAETMAYPGYSLNLSLYARDEVSRVGAPGGMGEGGSAFPVSTAAGMGEGVPRMPWYGTQDAFLREARQRLAGLRQELGMEKAAAELAVREAWFRLDRAARELALFGDRIAALSQAALEASTRGYSAGKVMFADVIMSYTGWFEANLAAERRRADLGIAWAELEAAVGASPLPARGEE